MTFGCVAFDHPCNALGQSDGIYGEKPRITIRDSLWRGVHEKEEQRHFHDWRGVLSATIATPNRLAGDFAPGGARVPQRMD